MKNDGQTAINRTIAKTALTRACLATALLLTACGGSKEAPPPQAQASDVTVGAANAGPTPFIGLVPLTGKALNKVIAYRFTIAPKPGAISKPVDVTYSFRSMMRLGHYVSGSAAASLPVFGLYPRYANQVTIDLIYGDGSHKAVPIIINTEAYVDQYGIFGQPNILKKRDVAGADLNYFYLKSQLTGPIVVDSDGEIRWVAPTRPAGVSSKFDKDSFVVGAPTSATFSRIGLDGKVAGGAVASTSYSLFHHSLDNGKTGLLAELDGVLAGKKSIESSLIEMGPAGEILKEWDFADILGRYMRSQGDDPSYFIRPGADWFHINAATYDARDDSIIASSRENFVIKFDYRTGDVKWILGDPTKFWYTYSSLRAKALTLEGGGLYPIGQHSTSINSSGHLMLFNNGLASLNQPFDVSVGATRTYSTVSAYQIDPVRMTATETWQFDYGKTIYSDICSSAYEAKGGSILISYATANKRTRARLVGLDTARNVMFDFEYKTTNCGTSWNAEPIAFDGMTIQ